MLSLSKMTKKQFQSYLEFTIPDYAKDKIESGTWKEEEALNLAKESYQKYLPNGVETPNEFLYAINLKETHIGFMWLHYDSNKTESAFIYDFLIMEDYQGKGYGQQAMTLMFDTVKEFGASRLSLHVFGHNKRALHVYEKLGFEITDYSMSKDI